MPPKRSYFTPKKTDFFFLKYWFKADFNIQPLQTIAVTDSQTAAGAGNERDPLRDTSSSPVSYSASTPMSLSVLLLF